MESYFLWLACFHVSAITSRASRITDPGAQEFPHSRFTVTSRNPLKTQPQSLALSVESAVSSSQLRTAGSYVAASSHCSSVSVLRPAPPCPSSLLGFLLHCGPGLSPTVSVINC